MLPMKPNHKSFKDFTNLHSAITYLDELKVKVREMQRKYDMAKGNHPPYEVAPEWFRRLTTALKCHKKELEMLEKEIGAAERKESVRQENFYRTFYECAKLNLGRSTFDMLGKATRQTIVRATQGKTGNVGIASYDNPDFQGNGNQVQGNRFQMVVVEDMVDMNRLAFTNGKDWRFADLSGGSK